MPNGDVTESDDNSLKEASPRLGLRVQIHIIEVVVAFMGLVVAIIVAVIIYYAYLIVTPRQAERLKQIDVEINCNQRFSDLSKLRIDIEKMRKDKKLKLGSLMTSEIGEYYRQFWALQEDQFYYYNQGFLPEHLYL